VGAGGDSVDVEKSKTFLLSMDIIRTKREIAMNHYRYYIENRFPGDILSITDQYNNIRRTFKEKIIFLYGHKCAICNKYHSDLQIHHIVPICSGGSNDIANLIPLCPECHTIVHRMARNRKYVDVLCGCSVMELVT
jgi:5-methylcytosine-specific restriction endonuclease McrA